MAVTKPKELEDDDWGFLPADEAPIEPVRRKGRELIVAPKAERMERLRDIEDKLLERSLTVVSDTLYARDIEPGAKEPPPDWHDMDPDEAIKRLRTANAAWMNKKEAPVFLETGLRVAVGIIKARSVEKAGPKTLNVQVIQMSAPLPKFEVVEMEDEDR